MKAFFYGLYMDAGLLESMGYRPLAVGPARLDGYRLMIGDRATLLPAEGKSCYGVLIELSDEDLSALYARSEVRDYAPQTVTATLLSDSSQHEAFCYLLPPDEARTTPNKEYALKLAALVTRLGLPAEYAQEIERLGAP